MEVIGYENGHQIQRREDDLDYLEMDIVKDFVREYGNLDSSPESRIEIDFTNPAAPTYKLVNCSEEFKNLFYNKFYFRKKEKIGV